MLEPTVIEYSDLDDNEKTQYHIRMAQWHRQMSILTNERNNLVSASGRTIPKVDSDIAALGESEPTPDDIRPTVVEEP